MTIPLGCASPAHLVATYPGGDPENRVGPKPCAAPIRSCSRWGLPCRPCCQGPRCALTAPFHPCSGRARSGLLSVALSLGSPPPGVTRHRVSVEPGLSSIAPFRTLRQRSSGRLAFRPALYGPSGRLGPVARLAFPTTSPPPATWPPVKGRIAPFRQKRPDRGGRCRNPLHFRPPTHAPRPRSSTVLRPRCPAGSR
jgi:hypothetical protein